jgi:hypothetical protein
MQEIQFLFIIYTWGMVRGMQWKVNSSYYKIFLRPFMEELWNRIDFSYMSMNICIYRRFESHSRHGYLLCVYSVFVLSCM